MWEVRQIAMVAEKEAAIQQMKNSQWIKLVTMSRELKPCTFRSRSSFENILLANGNTLTLVYNISLPLATLKLVENVRLLP